MPLSIARKAISDAHLSRAIPSIFFVHCRVLFAVVARFPAHNTFTEKWESHSVDLESWRAQWYISWCWFDWFWLIFFDPSPTTLKLIEPNWLWKRFGNQDRLEMFPNWMRFIVSLWGLYYHFPLFWYLIIVISHPCNPHVLAHHLSMVLWTPLISAAHPLCWHQPQPFLFSLPSFLLFLPHFS